MATTATINAPIQHSLDELSREIAICSRAYNGKKIKCSIFLTGTDANTGKPFAHTLTIEKDSEELKAFFNDYGATLAAHKMEITHNLQPGNHD